MSKTNFKAEKLNIKGAYNANRYLYKACRYNQDRVIAKSDKAAEWKAYTDNDLFTIQCRCGIITVSGLCKVKMKK